METEAIKKGRHKTFRFPKLTFKNKIKGKVIFSGDFSYKIDKQDDTNKLVGLSDNWHHHKDSIRIGWRYYHSRLEIMAIIYRDGVRKIHHLAYAETDTQYEYAIQLLKDKYLITFNKMSLMVDRTSNWNFIRYQLFPYFGGTTKAPKDFLINISYEL